MDAQAFLEAPFGLMAASAALLTLLATGGKAPLPAKAPEQANGVVIYKTSIRPAIAAVRPADCRIGWCQDI